MSEPTNDIPPERLVRKSAEEIRQWAASPAAQAEGRRLAAMTDEDIRRAAMDDPDCPPLTDAQLARMKPVRSLAAALRDDASDEVLLDAITELTQRLRSRRADGRKAG